MISGFDFTFSPKLPTTLTSVVLNLHSSKNPLYGGAIVEHNPNDSTNRNMLRNRDHVILISRGFSPACHFCFSKNKKRIEVNTACLYLT